MAEDSDPWQSLWHSLSVLRQHARKLRHLSQVEPLLQARPDYPRARTGRSHASEVRDVLEDVARILEEAKRLLPEVLPDSQSTAGVSADEGPAALAKRMDTLAHLVHTLQREAFEPPPHLPAHAPPYLAEAPRHDLAGAKAILLSLGIEETVSSLRNLLLASRNEGDRGPARPQG